MGTINEIPEGAKCEACPFAKGGRPPHPPVYGVVPATISGMLVAESPGHEEVVRGMPLVGPTGQSLDVELREAGLQRATLAIVNATLCRPPPGKSMQSMEAAVRCCSGAFGATIRTVPRTAPVLTMGRWAYAAFTGKSKGIAGWRGFVQKQEKHPLILTWHPTYAFYRNPWELGAFKIDLNRFARLVRGELKLKSIQPKTNIIPTVEDIEAFHQKGLKGVPIAVDIETKPAENDEDGHTGNCPLRCRLDLLGLGDVDSGLSFGWDSADGRLRSAVERLLGDGRVVKVWQNGTDFDERVLGRYSLVARNVVDTFDARRAVSASAPLALAHMASVYTDAPPWKKGEGADAKGLVFTSDRDAKRRYNASDCVFTARVWKGITMEPDWSTERVQRIHFVQRHRAALAAEMSSNGLLLDSLTHQYLAWGLEQQYIEQEAALKAEVDIPAFNCQPEHMRAILYKRHEKKNLSMFSLPDPIDPKRYTNEGLETIAVDEDALLLLLINPTLPPALHRIIQLYWDAQATWKQRSTFVTSKKLLNALHPDGRVRAGWNSGGTETYRYTCSDPNLLNIEKWLRAMYVAPSGQEMIGADWRQLELCIRRDVMHDRTLAADLASGDVYSANARDWFGLPADFDVKALKPEARQACKVIHLLSQYGGGVRQVYRQWLRQDRKAKFSMAQGLAAGFERRYVDTVNFWEEEHKRVMECGYSESRILHRRLVYPAPPERTKTANHPIQTTASDVADLVAIELRKRLKKYVPQAQIVVQQYDAFYSYAPARAVKDVVEITRECMEMPFMVDGKECIYRADIKVGHTWKDVS